MGICPNRRARGNEYVPLSLLYFVDQIDYSVDREQLSNALRHRVVETDDECCWLWILSNDSCRHISSLRSPRLATKLTASNGQVAFRSASYTSRGVNRPSKTP
jgi:hypothetical protein